MYTTYLLPPIFLTVMLFLFGVNTSDHVGRLRSFFSAAFTIRLLMNCADVIVTRAAVFVLPLAGSLYDFTSTFILILLVRVLAIVRSASSSSGPWLSSLPSGCADEEEEGEGEGEAEGCKSSGVSSGSCMSSVSLGSGVREGDGKGREDSENEGATVSSPSNGSVLSGSLVPEGEGDTGMLDDVSGWRDCVGSDCCGRSVGTCDSSGSGMSDCSGTGVCVRVLESMGVVEADTDTDGD